MLWQVGEKGDQPTGTGALGTRGSNTTLPFCRLASPGNTNNNAARTRRARHLNASLEVRTVGSSASLKEKTRPKGGITGSHRSGNFTSFRDARYII